MRNKIIILVIILILIGVGAYLSHLYSKKTPERLEKTIENRVINGMNQIQNVARAIYEENKDYSKVSCLHSELTSICKELDLWLGKEPIIYSSSGAYCSYTGLQPGEYYCIDSTGFAGKVTTNPSETGYCDGITFVCKKEEVKDETANWKTYRSEEYGFEFKYPSNWEPDIHFGVEKSYFGGGPDFLLKFPTEDSNKSPNASIAFSVKNIASFSGDWEKQAKTWFKYFLILKGPEKINFKGREALTGQICQPDITGKNCQGEFSGGRTGQRNISDSLFTTSPDGKWLFQIFLQRFEPSDKETYLMDVYKKFLDSFKFIE